MSTKLAEGRLRPLSETLRALEAKKSAMPIRALRFPCYRNLEANARLPLDFPVTVLLGCNGANKSSILHALYGAPRGKSVGEYWFETSLDAIPALRDGLKQSFTHTYVDAGKLTECIKARAPRKDDPDYWEAVKPTQKYGFPKGATRKPPIELDVLYLDFRAELPAHDKYFNFPDPAHLRRRAAYAKARRRFRRRDYRPQDYLRQRTLALKKKMEQEAVDFTADELAILRYVLGRQYVSGRILRHSLFHGHDGRTIQFTTKDFTGGYSDAFAGSGESAATFLVHDIIRAPKRSLVLLDEPETSLHPRAQHRMLEFVCDRAMRQGLQVVMATHSSHLAEKLPQDAIRVLESTEVGRVRILTSCSVNEALHEISDMVVDRVASVEDERAKHLVLSALDASSLAAREAVKVMVRAGGTSRIFRDILAHSEADENTTTFFVLDGDHRPTTTIPADGDLPQGLPELKRLIDEATCGLNRKGQKLPLRDAAEASRYLAFLRDHVRYLPGDTPESTVWEDAVVGALVQRELPQSVLDEPDHKERLRLVAALVPGHTDESIFKHLVASRLRDSSDARHELAALASELRGVPLVDTKT